MDGGNNTTNGTNPGDELKNKPIEEEMYSSWALLILTTLLIGALWTSYYLQLKKIRAIHETVISIMAGMLVGLVIKLSPGTIIQHMVQFNGGFFFNLLLPPIILNSGYELKRQNFFRNFGTILVFALVGTLISAVIIGACTFLYSLAHVEGLDISFLDSLIFGAILSATDPVTILAIFSQLGVDPKLFSIISGESLLNDAVAIVLSETLNKFRGQELHVANIFKGIGTFIGVFTASVAIGVLFGVSVALMLKYSQLHKYHAIESCLISLFAYSSYLFSNGAQMSGIVTLLFTGITLKHYAYDNMSRHSKKTTKSMFQVLSQLSENFIFIYLGVNLFTQEDTMFKPLFIFLTTIFICVARYFAVAPLSALVNAACKYLGKPPQLPRSHQVMLFWSGLRGAVAFALAAGLTGESGPAMRTTILVVVVLTVLIFGGTTNRMLQILGIRTGVTEHSDTSSSEDDDEEYARRRLRYRREHGRLNSEDSARQGLLDGDSDYDFDDIPRASGHLHSSNRDTSEQSIGGLLSGPIGHPIAEDTPHWFLSFDNKYLKPFFTKRHIHDRNKSIAEYWRSKKRKMERSQGSLLQSFTNMDFTNASFDDEDFGGNDNAVDLNPVASKSRNESGDIPPSSSSNLVVGSGRVFGRSIGSSLPYASPQRSSTPTSSSETRSKRDGPIHLRNN
ncbi:monovalent cation:H+ antiporter [Umbelopsis nana]